VPRAESRPAWAEVDLGAVQGNAAALAALVAPARLCAVVKADGYGHGAAPVARAALAGGASLLAVALVEEGAALRDAGIAAPVLLLSEPPPAALAEAAALDLTPTLYTPEAVAAAGRAGVPAAHMKVDTGMHRVGAAPADAPALARMLAEAGVDLAGVWTHLAAADDPAQASATAAQLAAFEEVRARLAADGRAPALVHAANSAAALAWPPARLDLVRCGITLYGHPPSAAVATPPGLRPALTLRARVTLVRTFASAERVSYGRRYEVAAGSQLATVPLGYADGVPRRLPEVGGQVLVRGRRCPIAGTVTMDQLMVDCGPAGDVAPGDEVVLLGRQGAAEVTAEEWAARLGTIAYEVLCAIGPRVPRRYRDR